MMRTGDFKTIDEYIRLFPADIQNRLRTLRETIRKAAPEATEKISYQMPTFYINGNLVHFAAYDKHIGFYPAPSGLDSFEKELAPYRKGKGTAQFPHDKPLPLNLITKIVKYRIKENLGKNRPKGY